MTIHRPTSKQDRMVGVKCLDHAGMNGNQNRRLNPLSDNFESVESRILNERILLLVFESINWDPRVLCLVARVNRKLRAVTNRLLWKELCVSRAPRMVAALVNCAPNGRVGGEWHALAKLLFFCCGCGPSQHFRVNRSLPGHFVKESRFSKTCGRSFLTKKCQGDCLYISDPCEHVLEGNEDDLGIYRGVFRGFIKSRTRACLIKRQVGFEERVRCPYCGARVWSMTSARLVPKSASRRLGSHKGKLEYFVCLNGHLHGACWLVRLSSDEEDGYDDEEEENDVDGGPHGEVDDDDQMRKGSQNNGSATSSSGEVIGDRPAF